MQRRVASLTLAGLFLAFLMFLQPTAAHAGADLSVDRAVAHSFTDLAAAGTVAAGATSGPEYSCSPTITVTSADDSGPGTLRQALEDICVDKTINFDANTMAGATITVASELVVTKGLTISGLASSPGVTISGGGTTRVFNVTASARTVTFDHLTIANGNVLTTDCGSAVDQCGGGIMVQNTDVSVYVTNSTFSGNSSGGVGGAITNEATLTVANSTFSGNSAVIGGGIFNLKMLTVKNSTFSGNSADHGGGIANYTSGTLDLLNSLIANSTSGGDCDNRGTIAANDRNLIEGAGAAACGIVNGSGGTITGIDPLLAPLGEYGGPVKTFALLPGSPALDAGNGDDPTTCLETDQRGQDRVDACDIGAFESQGYTLAATGGTPQSALVYTDFTDPLEATLTETGGSALPGGVVTFTPPATGPTAVLLSGTATTDNHGKVSVTATANGSAGSYSVSASATGVTPAVFSLTNWCTVTVTSIDDSGPGTLRQAIADVCDGGTIDFDEDLAGETITLTGGQLGINKNLSIDGLPGPEGVTVSGNRASRVFYIYPAVYKVALRHLTIAGANAGSSDGGGIDCTWSNTELLVQNCTISDNSAHAGAGIWNNCKTTVQDSTFSNNAATLYGGGVANHNTLVMENNTLSGNSAPDGSGGGIYSSSTLRLSNTVIANTTAGGDCRNSGTISADDHNLIEAAGADACGLSAGAGGNLIGLDPLLAPLGDYGGPPKTFALLPGSPALDSGNDATCLPKDQRGKDRVGAHCDIGSFEAQGFTLAATGGTPQSGPTETDFAAPLEATLTETGGSALPGAVVTFAPPATGPSALLSSGTATTDDDGKASVTATANSIVGGPYNVTASVSGATGANFSLANSCANAITVTSYDDSGPSTLRQAIADVCDGGTIDFDEDLAGETITLTGDLVIGKNLTITGLTGSPGVTISGDHKYRGFHITGGNVNLQRLTIADGRGVHGGGIDVTSRSATVVVEVCTFTGNLALDGNAGGAIHSYGSLTVKDSLFSGNSTEAGFGGGISNDGTLAVTNSVFTGNSASPYWGGGIANHVGTATVKNCTFSGNSAGKGGGIWNAAGQTLTVQSVTFSDNSATSGGGIYNAGTLHLSNTLIANSASGGDCQNIDPGTVDTNDQNLIESTGSDACGLNDGDGGSIVGIDPLLAPLGDYGGGTRTFALLPGSPALDAGDNALCIGLSGLRKDQRAKDRVGACDIGSFEAQGFTLDKTGGDGQATQISTPFTNPLEVTLSETGGSGLPGAVITFTPPAATGPSAVLSSTTATTDADGKASVTASANDTEGAYNVSATTGALTADIGLTNLPPPCLSATLAAALVGSEPGTASLDSIILTASVTNAGPAGLPAGIPVRFTADGGEIGVVATTEALAAGAATTVSVEWVPPAGDLAITVTPQPENADPPLTLCGVPAPAAAQALTVFDRPLWDVWEQISFPVQPQNAAASVVVRSMGTHYQGIRSYDGSAQVYYPQLPPEFSTLQTMDAEHGYWIKTTALAPPPGWMENPPPEAILRVSGQRLAEDHPLALQAGWNLVSYLPRTSLDVRDALASIAGKYTAVSGWERGSQSYYPSQAWSWATLKVLKPGFGYWINMTEAATLTYPVTVGAPVAPAVDAATAEAARLAAVRQAEAVAGVAPSGTWADFAGYALQRDGTPYAAGTVLEALDPQGTVCGATVVGEGGAFGPLACYGDQADTAVDEGAQPGDVIRVVAAGDAQVEVGRGVWTGPLGFQRIGKPAGKGPVKDGAPGEAVPAAN